MNNRASHPENQRLVEDIAAIFGESSNPALYEEIAHALSLGVHEKRHISCGVLVPLGGRNASPTALTPSGATVTIREARFLVDGTFTYVDRQDAGTIRELLSNSSIETMVQDQDCAYISVTAGKVAISTSWGTYKLDRLHWRRTPPATELLGRIEELGQGAWQVSNSVLEVAVGFANRFLRPDGIGATLIIPASSTASSELRALLEGPSTTDWGSAGLRLGHRTDEVLLRNLLSQRDRAVLFDEVGILAVADVTLPLFSVGEAPAEVRRSGLRHESALALSERFSRQVCCIVVSVDGDVTAFLSGAHT